MGAKENRLPIANWRCCRGDSQLAPRGRTSVEIKETIALHEAIRSVRPSGRVVAAGFYQGEGVGLRLGEEFHLNQVELVSSQIGSVPSALKARWDRDRLERVIVELLSDRTLDVSPLVSHVFDVADVAEAFALLDERPAEALQVVLQFPAAMSRGFAS